MEYIQDLHNNLDWGKSDSCTILKCHAQKIALAKNDIREASEELKTEDRLLMAVYSNDRTGKNNHCVVVGWDSETSQYFVRDPNEDSAEYKDIFKMNEINEYILFERCDKYL